MIRIPCPCCGLRDYTEFTYGGDATIAWPALKEQTGEVMPPPSAEDLAAWNTAVFQRANPRGHIGNSGTTPRAAGFGWWSSAIR